MKGKKLLTAFLLGVSFCFVPIQGYGEIQEWINEVEISTMDFILLKEHVRYIMQNPTNFLNIDVFYDPDGRFGAFLPEGVNTKRKVCVRIQDSRDVFCDKPGTALLNEFKNQLEIVYWSIKVWATNINTDVVALFLSKEMTPLGYFYQGEYYLWEK